jgi:quinol monooxygenase YgiN
MLKIPYYISRLSVFCPTSSSWRTSPWILYQAVQILAQAKGFKPLLQGEDGMPRISAKSSVVTLINVFTVEPVNQPRLIELLTEATEVSVRQARGFVSASLHRSTDGTKVTMYAQWRSIDDYQAMRRDPTPLPFLEEALAIAKFEPGIYEVVQTFTPAGESRQRN